MNYFQWSYGNVYYGKIHVFRNVNNIPWIDLGFFMWEVYIYWWPDDYYFRHEGTCFGVRLIGAIAWFVFDGRCIYDCGSFNLSSCCFVIYTHAWFIYLVFLFYDAVFFWDIYLCVPLMIEHEVHVECYCSWFHKTVFVMIWLLVCMRELTFFWFLFPFTRVLI